MFDARIEFVKILLVYMAIVLILEPCRSAKKSVPSPSKKRRVETKRRCALRSFVLRLLILANWPTSELTIKLLVKIVLARRVLVVKLLALIVNALSVLKDVLIKTVDVFVRLNVLKRLITVEPKYPFRVLVL